MLTSEEVIQNHYFTVVTVRGVIQRDEKRLMCFYRTHRTPTFLSGRLFQTHFIFHTTLAIKISVSSKE